MSRERFFSPKSLARVCEAVEWEDELTWYRDGSTNQSEYMKALAILWERWMREWSIPDFAQSVFDVGSGQFVDGLERILRGIPSRIQQILGFYRGLWAGANPGWRSIVPRFLFGSQPALTDGDRAKNEILYMIKSLEALLEEWRRSNP